MSDTISWPRWFPRILTLDRVLGAVLREVGRNEDFQGREGVYFCLADGRTGFPLLVLLSGKVRLEKAEKYLTFCQEKARRLAAHPEHLSSFENRNPVADQWGGAVRFDEYIFSISGLSELADEATVMMLACCAIDGVYIEEIADDVAFKSHNHYWGRIRYLMPQLYEATLKATEK